ncbi:hypothetical protein [Rickettsia endosymbiont of Rhinocyllus conicus]
MLGNVIPIKGKNTIIIKEYDNKDLLSQIWEKNPALAVRRFNI